MQSDSLHLDNSRVISSRRVFRSGNVTQRRLGNLPCPVGKYIHTGTLILFRRIHNPFSDAFMDHFQFLSQRVGIHTGIASTNIDAWFRGNGKQRITPVRVHIGMKLIQIHSKWVLMLMLVVEVVRDAIVSIFIGIVKQDVSQF